jgi:hypothetical protein
VEDDTTTHFCVCRDLYVMKAVLHTSEHVGVGSSEEMVFIKYNHVFDCFTKTRAITGAGALGSCKLNVLLLILLN